MGSSMQQPIVLSDDELDSPATPVLDSPTTPVFDLPSLQDISRDLQSFDDMIEDWAVVFGTTKNAWAWATNQRHARIEFVAEIVVILKKIAPANLLTCPSGCLKSHRTALELSPWQSPALPLRFPNHNPSRNKNPNPLLWLISRRRQALLLHHRRRQALLLHHHRR